LARVLELGFNQKVDVAAFARVVGARTKQTHPHFWVKTIPGGLRKNLALEGGQAHKIIVRVGSRVKFSHDRSKASAVTFAGIRKKSHSMAIADISGRMPMSVREHGQGVRHRMDCCPR
jgi:hypothetical protein